MIVKSCGYVVLRKSEYNFDELGRGAFLQKAPKLDTIYYGGIDRMQWFDIDEDFYNKILPNNLIKIRENIFKNSSAKNDSKICLDFDEAKELLKYSNKNENRNEILVVHSLSLAESICSFEIEVEEKSIGCDLYCDGYGSIIRDGIFKKPELFKEFTIDINENGIFDIENESIFRYIKAYDGLSKDGKLEIMTGPINKIFLYRSLGDLGDTDNCALGKA